MKLIICVFQWFLFSIHIYSFTCFTKLKRCWSTLNKMVKILQTTFANAFYWKKICIFLAATKQLCKWYFPSVRMSVCLSVRHTFLTMFPSSYHHEIFRSYYQWQKWRPCKRSRSEVKGQGHRGHNPTLPFPDCNSILNSRMMMKWCI